MKKLKVSLAIFCAIFISSHVYGQGDIDKAVSDLVNKTLSQVKGVAVNRNLVNVALWKVEVDKGRVVDVTELTNRMNVRLIEEGLLKERRVDFTGVKDRDALTERGNIYRISAFLYGKETVVSGNVVKVSFEMFDIESGETIWESVISGGEVIVAAGLSAMALGKWGTLGVGGASGVGALTTLALSLDAYQKYLDPKVPPGEADKFYEQANGFLTWGIILSSVSLVSSGVSIYLFLTDRGEETVGFLDKIGDENIALRVTDGGVVLSGQVRF